MQIEENYNEMVREYLDTFGLKLSTLEPVFNLKQSAISQKLMYPKTRRTPFTKDDFLLIVEHFKDKANELHRIYTQ